MAFSIAEAAEAASVGRTKIYEALNTGALKARKQGRRTIILAGDLSGWLESLPDYHRPSRNGAPARAEG